MHLDSLLDKHGQLLGEKIAGHKIILVLDNILDQLINCMNLVIFQGILDSVRVVVAATVFFQHFVFVNDWVFL